MDPVFFVAPAPPPAPVPPRTAPECATCCTAVKEARAAAIEQCAGILLGELGRLRKIQAGCFSGSRDAQIAKLYSMASKLRKLK